MCLCEEQSGERKSKADLRAVLTEAIVQSLESYLKPKNEDAAIKVFPSDAIKRDSSCLGNPRLVLGIVLPGAQVAEEGEEGKEEQGALRGCEVDLEFKAIFDSEECEEVRFGAIGLSLGKSFGEVDRTRAFAFLTGWLS